MEKADLSSLSSFTAEEEAYGRVLLDNPQVSRELPQWYTASDRWADWVESVKDVLRSLLNKYFPSNDEAGVNSINREFILRMLELFFWVTLIGLSACLVYFLIKKWRDRGTVPSLGKAETPALVTREERLVELILRHMQQGEWARAAKLRWRLFLERKGLRTELTPLEYENSGAPGLPRALEQYEQMFTGSKGSESWYHKYSQTLRKSEESQ